MEILIKAKELILFVANSGADYVKFQTFKADLVSLKMQKRQYIRLKILDNQSHNEMIKN